jgi:hypothetical protein
VFIRFLLWFNFMGSAENSIERRRNWKRGLDSSLALISIRIVLVCDDFKSFSFLFLLLFRQGLGDFPEEKD